MKKCVVFLMAVIPILAIGQIGGGSSKSSDYRLRETVNDIVVKANYGPKSYKELAAEGSQYFNENFVEGRVSLNGKQSAEIYSLRYNAFVDVVEVQKTEAMEHIYKHHNVTCLIGKEHYVYQKFKNNDVDVFGYMQILFEASDFKIFVRKTKILKEGKQATTSLTQSWPAKFIDDVSYYFLSSTEEIAYEVNKKNLIPHSKEDNEKLLKFAKSRKLNLDNENDIIEIYEYYNSSINN